MLLLLRWRQLLLNIGGAAVYCAWPWPGRLHQNKPLGHVGGAVRRWREA